MTGCFTGETEEPFRVCYFKRRPFHLTSGGLTFMRSRYKNKVFINKCFWLKMSDMLLFTFFYISVFPWYFNYGEGRNVRRISKLALKAELSSVFVYVI